MKKILTTLAIISSLTVIAGCNPTTTEVETETETTTEVTIETSSSLEGAWNYTESDGTEDGLALDWTWTFEKDTYKIIGYPEYNQEGKYKILSEEEDTITVEFSEVTGDGNTENQTIEINKTEEGLIINGQGPYQLHRS